MEAKDRFDRELKEYVQGFQGEVPSDRTNQSILDFFFGLVERYQSEEGWTANVLDNNPNCVNGWAYAEYTISIPDDDHNYRLVITGCPFRLDVIFKPIPTPEEHLEMLYDMIYAGKTMDLDGMKKSGAIIDYDISRQRDDQGATEGITIKIMPSAPARNVNITVDTSR